MAFKMKGSALYGHGTPMKQKTDAEEKAELKKSQEAFIKKKSDQIKKKGDDLNFSIDSINNVNKNYKTQQQKDYNTLSVAEYNKKYPQKKD